MKSGPIRIDFRYLGDGTICCCDVSPSAVTSRKRNASALVYRKIELVLSSCEKNIPTFEKMINYNENVTIMLNKNSRNDIKMRFKGRTYVSAQLHKNYMYIKKKKRQRQVNIIDDRKYYRGPFDRNNYKEHRDNLQPCSFK